jgi:hypothetical protein
MMYGRCADNVARGLDPPYPMARGKSHCQVFRTVEIADQRELENVPRWIFLDVMRLDKLFCMICLTPLLEYGRWNLFVEKLQLCQSGSFSLRCCRKLRVTMRGPKQSNPDTVVNKWYIASTKWTWTCMYSKISRTKPEIAAITTMIEIVSEELPSPSGS